VLDPLPRDPLLLYGLGPAPALVGPVGPLAFGTGGPGRTGAADPPSTAPELWLSVVVGASELAGFEAIGGPVGFLETAAVATRRGGVLWGSFRGMVAFR
jgi:hypothetical protein